jgi:anti-sigma B factor antagonist/stage II sporulation protein AA (anti-sigma F factor antagonist)
MEVSTRRYADVVVAEAAGRIDFTNAEEFKTALWQAIAQNQGERGPVVIDFSRVDYISSVGLRVLMLAAKEMNGGQRKITIAAPSPVVREIIEISRFHLILAVFASVREALERLSPRALAALDASPNAN